MRYYDSADEVRRRLTNGIVLYRGEPVLAIEAKALKSSKSKFAVILRNLPDQDKSWTTPLDDPELNYRQIRLGFLNLDGDVVRAIRYPQRGVQQSLSENNCYVTELDNRERGAVRNGELFTITRLLQRHKSCVDSLAGRFPSKEEARDQVQMGKAKSVAFHYDWAYQTMMGAPVLWYKTNPVGLTIDPREIFKLDESLKFLKEPLEEIGLRVAK